MGLDITAYRKLAATRAPLDHDKNIVLSDCMEKHFPGRMVGVSAGIYSFAERMEFRAGSYRGYNEWRDELAALAGFTSARHLWSLMEVNPALKGPFVELINFADNEGVIGPVVAEKLRQDFERFIGEAEARGGWFLECYRRWQRAFEVASDHGAVEFH